MAVPACLGVDRQFKAGKNGFHGTVVRNPKRVRRAIRVPRRDFEDEVGVIAWGAVFVVVGRPVLASLMNAPANAFGVLSAVSVVIFAGQIRLQQIALSHLLRRVARMVLAIHLPMKQSGIRVPIGSVGFTFLRKYAPLH